MKRTAFAVLLFVASVVAQTQPRTVQIRLFWQHPPSRIRITPQEAHLRTCSSCAPAPLNEPIEITAKSSSVLAGTVSSPMVLLSGRVRISGNDFSPFVTDHELRLQARDDLLLLTLTMPREEYVTAVRSEERRVGKEC